MALFVRTPARVGGVLARGLSSAAHPVSTHSADIEPEPVKVPDPCFKLRWREFIPLATRKEMLAAMDQVPYDHKEAHQFYLKHLKKPEELPPVGSKEWHVYRAMIHTAKNRADTWTMPILTFILPVCLLCFYKF